MKPILSILAVIVLFGLAASSASAQATRTWVSGVGDDANPCSRTAPCKTFAGAISKTAAGGDINCLDPGGFGTLTITKAIEIACDEVAAHISALGTNGITVSAGAGDVVVLRGLHIEGNGTGLVGIKFNTGAALHVENCVINGFLGSPGHGVSFTPSAASALFVLNTVIRDNNRGATAAGIFIQPSGTGTTTGVIDNAQLLNNGNGLLLDGTQTTGSLVATILRNSVASNNAANGVNAIDTSGKAAGAHVTIDRTAVTGNNTGVATSGTNADVTLAYSVVTDNSTGLSFAASAELRSYQTNQLRANIVSNGASSATIPLE